MPRPNRRLTLEQSYKTLTASENFRHQINSVLTAFADDEVILSQGYVDDPDKFDTEDMYSVTVDGYPEQLTKQTFRVTIERSSSSRDRCLFRVNIEWFGVNREDIAEMEERGTEILQNLHECLTTHLEIDNPTGEFSTASQAGRTA